MTDDKRLKKMIADRITRAYQNREDPNDVAEGVFEVIRHAECTICPDNATVGMVRELLRGLGIEDADAGLGSRTFRKHIEPLKRAIAASPLGNRTDAPESTDER